MNCKKVCLTCDLYQKYKIEETNYDKINDKFNEFTIKLWVNN